MKLSDRQLEQSSSNPAYQCSPPPSLATKSLIHRSLPPSCTQILSSVFATMDRNRVLTRAEIEAKIADGHVVIISEGRVLQLDGWLDKHPGGRLAVLHMVGRDATDEINVYVSVPSSLSSQFLPATHGGRRRRRRRRRRRVPSSSQVTTPKTREKS